MNSDIHGPSPGNLAMHRWEKPVFWTMIAGVVGMLVFQSFFMPMKMSDKDEFVSGCVAEGRGSEALCACSYDRMGAGDLFSQLGKSASLDEASRRELDLRLLTEVTFPCMVTTGLFVEACQADESKGKCECVADQIGVDLDAAGRAIRQETEKAGDARTGLDAYLKNIIAQSGEACP